VTQAPAEVAESAAARRRFPLRRILTAILLLATGYYLYASVAGNWSELRRFAWEVDPLRLGASVAVHVAVLAGGVWIWSRVLDHFEHPPVRTGTLMRIWFVSNLARYIPGKVFQFVVAGQLASAAGLTGSVLLTSLVMHTGFSLLAATVVSAWTVVTPLAPGLPAIPIGAAVTLLAVAAVHPRLLNAALGVVPRLLKKTVIGWNGSWLDGVALLFYSMVAWTVYGVAYWLLIASLIEVPVTAIPRLTGINAFSFVGGYLALTPAGIGIRELVMTNLLIPLVGGSGVAAVLSIASRLWTVAAELVGGVLALALGGARGRSESVDNPGPP
jgi:glycosyltransferase 2 family protein